MTTAKKHVSTSIALRLSASLAALMSAQAAQAQEQEAD